jgi:hypothetical protein
MQTGARWLNARGDGIGEGPGDEDRVGMQHDDVGTQMAGQDVEKDGDVLPSPSSHRGREDEKRGSATAQGQEQQAMHLPH